MSRMRTVRQRRTRRIPPGAVISDLSHTYLLQTVDPAEDVQAFCRLLQADPHVEYAEPNYVARVHFHPNDPYDNTGQPGSWGQPEPDLWGLQKLQTEQAWDVTQGLKPDGQPIVVAVIDSGVDYSHPDIANNIWMNPQEAFGVARVDDDGNGFVDDARGWDFTSCAKFDESFHCMTPKNRGNDPKDDNGHGTHVAGTIAATGNNGLGIIGVAPKAKIMAIKGLNADGGGDNADIVAAIDYAIRNGADIINASWGTPPSNVIRDAIQNAHAAGVVVVAAAGNASCDVNGGPDPSCEETMPASLPEVIAVSATDENDHMTSFSNFGNKIDVAAPGGGSERALSCLVDLQSPNTDVCQPCDPNAPNPNGTLCLPSIDLIPNILSLRAHIDNCQAPTFCRLDDPTFPATCVSCDPAVDGFLCSPFPVTTEQRPACDQSLIVGDDYLRLAGTSMAAPHVSGVAALVLAHRPDLTNEDVRQILRASADDVESPGFDTKTGFGRVNAAKALNTEPNPFPNLNHPPMITTSELLQGRRILDDFDGASLVASWWDRDGTTVYQRSFGPPSADGINAMQVSFDKGNLPWSFFAAQPRQDGIANDWTGVNELRFWLRGQVDLLVKLEDSAGATYQQQVRTTSSTDWQAVSIDLRNAPINKAAIANVLFFAAPGLSNVTGSFAMDALFLHREIVLAARVGTPVTLTLSGSDPDGTLLSYSVTGLPSGTTFDPTSGRFQWTPSASQLGNFAVTFTVSDGFLSDSETATVTVTGGLTLTIDSPVDGATCQSDGTCIGPGAGPGPGPGSGSCPIGGIPGITPGC